MRRAVLTTGGLMVMCALAAAQQGPAAPWTLVEHTVATDLRGGYHVTAADINKDGRTDLLAVALAPKSDLVWFENPTWTRHVMASGHPSMINADAFDTDKDGYPEVVLQTGFSTTPAKGDGRMILLTKGADVNAPWTAKEFDRMPSVHRVRWADVEGNGRKMAINAPLAGVNGAAPDYKDKVGLYAYALPDLQRQTITEDDEGVLHGITVVDWDGKGREAVLSASFMGIFLHRYNNGKWQRTRLTAGSPEAWPKNGSSDAVEVRMQGGRQLAAIEPWHGNQVVIYRGKGDSWGERTVIDDTLNDGHTMVNADLDGDGTDEVIAGYRGGGGGVNIYRRGAREQWTKYVVAAPEQKSMAAAGCVAAHLNGDRRIDLACIGTATANLKWYENQPAK